MTDTPNVETTPTTSAMWEHGGEHPGRRKWHAFGTTTGTQTRRLCDDHDPVIQARKIAS